MKRESLYTFLLGLLVTVSGAQFWLTYNLMRDSSDMRERVARIETKLETKIAIK
jgi:hypothetical protein